MIGAACRQTQMQNLGGAGQVRGDLEEDVAGDGFHDGDGGGRGVGGRGGSGEAER